MLPLPVEASVPSSILIKPVAAMISIVPLARVVISAVSLVLCDTLTLARMLILPLTLLVTAL